MIIYLHASFIRSIKQKLIYLMNDNTRGSPVKVIFAFSGRDKASITNSGADSDSTSWPEERSRGLNEPNGCSFVSFTINHYEH